MKKMHLSTLLLLSGLLHSAAFAQPGAKEDSTLESAGNKVTEPFDGKEVPQKLKDIQDDPYSAAKSASKRRHALPAARSARSSRSAASSAKSPAPMPSGVAIMKRFMPVPCDAVF